jgi:hypothetical protein
VVCCDWGGSCIVLYLMPRRPSGGESTPVHSVTGLAYERRSAGYSHAPQPRQCSAGAWRCLDSQRQARASQARKLSLLRAAPEESEAGNPACPMVVAQDQPLWAEARSMAVLLRCALCQVSPLGTTRTYSCHRDVESCSIPATGGAPGCAQTRAGGTFLRERRTAPVPHLRSLIQY